MGCSSRTDRFMIVECGLSEATLLAPHKLSMYSAFVLIIACIIALGNCIEFKHLAGPPSEFAAHRLPSPSEARISDNSTFYKLHVARMLAERDADDAHVGVPFLVDAEERFVVSFIHSAAHRHRALKLLLQAPNGEIVPAQWHRDHYPLSSDNSLSADTLSAIVENKGSGVLTFQGTWTLRIVAGTPMLDLAKEYANGGANSEASSDGALLVYNESPTSMTGALSTYKLEVSERIGLRAWLGAKSAMVSGDMTRNTVLSVDEERAAARANGDSVLDAHMLVRKPDGTEVDMKMHDDGLHNDLEANDGVWAAELDADEAGEYTAEALLSGQHADGTKFERSTQHVLRVVDDDTRLSGDAAIVPSPKHTGRMDVHLFVTEAAHVGAKYRAYAEVWHGETPVAWIGGMSIVQSGADGRKSVVLELDARWVARVDAAARSLSLREVTLYNVDYDIPLSHDVDAVRVAEHAAVLESVMSAMADVSSDEITEEMRVGVRPASKVVRDVSDLRSSHGTLLLHGYCASVNPFEKQRQVFTNNPLFFLDKDANKPNDAFALAAEEYVRSHNVDTFATIGHSQGGKANLHLLNYYWSGVDKGIAAAALRRANNASVGGPEHSHRAVQTLGTPWKGCSGAGSAASLAKIFGVGCGSNADLTTDGAKLWQSGISSWARAHAHYYTTTYKQGKLFGDWCSLVTNAVLKWPNDGTAELELSQLDGGVSEGNKEKWCHTTDMGYPAQYYDEARNKQMNQHTE